MILTQGDYLYWEKAEYIKICFYISELEFLARMKQDFIILKKQKHEIS